MPPQSPTPTLASTPTPALKPPPGVTSNFEHPESLLYLNDISVGVCIPIVTIFFFLRCLSRLWIKRSWIMEDWLATTAWIGTMAYCGVTSSTMRHNGGKHGWDITPEQAHQAAYWFNIVSIVYGVTICIAKIAVLVLYRRVFSPQRWKPFDLSIIALIVICALFYGSTTLVKIFECNPRAKIFNMKLPGHCIKIPMLLNVSGMFNTITDFIILVLPVKAVWNLNMTRQKKFIIILVFTFGLCAPAFSLIGFVVRIRATGSPDTTWVQNQIILWGSAEIATCNLCICFPEIGALFNRRRSTRPTASILNGNYRKSELRGRGSFANTASKASTNVKRSVGESYIELSDREVYGVQVDGGSRFKSSGDPNEVCVTSEVTVDTRNA